MVKPGHPLRQLLRKACSKVRFVHCRLCLALEFVEKVTQMHCLTVVTLLTFVIVIVPLVTFLSLLVVVWRCQSYGQVGMVFHFVEGCANWVHVIIEYFFNLLQHCWGDTAMIAEQVVNMAIIIDERKMSFQHGQDQYNVPSFI